MGFERLLTTSLLVIIGLLMFLAFIPVPVYVLTQVLGLKPLNMVEGIGIIIKSFFSLIVYYVAYKIVSTGKYRLSIGKAIGTIILVVLARATHSILNPIKDLEVPLGRSVIIAYDTFTSLLTSILILILIVLALTTILKQYLRPKITPLPPRPTQ